MDLLENTLKISSAKNKNGEIKIKARAVSRGIAIGKIVCLYGDDQQFYRTDLDSEKIDREIFRFRAAVRLTKRHIKNISSIDSVVQTNILDAHTLILEDSALILKIEKYIKSEKVNAEWAVKVITDKYIADYKLIKDEHLRERYVDLEDVTKRLLTVLGGESNAMIRLKKNSIIVAKEVRPSTLIELINSKPQAIITENGGWTSHTFILAREMNLPSVTGAKNILRRVGNGDEAIVDGFSGCVFLNPQEKTVRKYQTTVNKIQKQNDDIKETSNDAAVTLDGKTIKLRANLDLPTGYDEAKIVGAEGVGLFRSEFLYDQNKGYPTEKQQYEAYRKIARSVGEESVKIRTFDLNVEQLTDKNEAKQKNPALGLRAIRLSLTRVSQFKTQLRAILRASFGNNISILLPMVSDVSEILQTKKLIENEKKSLQKKGIRYGDPLIGAMIEVPSAILMIDEISAEADFLCLGTNDLVQYLLAVDRDNESVADWFRTLHPAVLRSIKIIVRAAENAEISVIVCGEMAGSPLYVPILIGLGVTELSMNVKSIPRVKKIISAIAYEEASEIIKQLSDCKTADQIEERVNHFFSHKWKHLFPNFILSSKT